MNTRTKEIIIETTAIGNPNVTNVMEQVKSTKDTHGTILGINFVKMIHKIVLF